MNNPVNHRLGLGRQTDVECGSEDRRRWRDAGAGTIRLQGLLEDAGRNRGVSSRTAGSRPATSRHLDEDGYLSITDRKKDLIKTSGGKFIAPQPIENSLKVNQYVAEAALLGDKRRFPAVLIIPSFDDLEDWARHHGVKFSSRKELVKSHQVQKLYEGIVEEVNRNLAQYEKLKKVLVVPDELSIADGTLTPSMKLRRRNLTDRYKKEIDALYSEAEAHQRSVGARK